MSGSEAVHQITAASPGKYLQGCIVVPIRSKILELPMLGLPSLLILEPITDLIMLFWLYKQVSDLIA